MKRMYEFLLDIHDSVKLIERGVAQKDTRYIVRAVRSLLKLRKRTSCAVLLKLINSTWASPCELQ